MQQRFELAEVKVVRRSDALQAITKNEVFRSKSVGDVQREVADAPGVREMVQMIVIANEITVRVCRPHLFQNPILAHFEDPGWSDENCRRVRRIFLPCAKMRDGFAVTLWILKFAIDRARVCLKDSVELSYVADEDYQFGSGNAIC